MKQVERAEAPEDVSLQPNTGMPEPPFRERSPDQDEFDRSFREGTRAMGKLLRSRRRSAEPLLLR